MENINRIEELQAKKYRAIADKSDNLEQILNMVMDGSSLADPALLSLNQRDKDLNGLIQTLSHEIITLRSIARRWEGT
jgi:hypothetical protein